MATSLARRSPQDGFDTYMSEVRRFSLLSREEEQVLAIRYRDEADITAAHALVTANLRFVAKVALEYRSYGLRILDLVQEGNVGLMHAVRKFDPDRGYRLITYAVWWIRAYIQSYLLRAWSLVKVGTTQAQRKLFFRLPAARAELMADEDTRYLSAEEKRHIIAERVGVRVKDVNDMEMRTAARDFSLDLALDDGGETTYLDMMESPDASSEQQVGATQLQGRIEADLGAALETLNDREREVIELRHLSDDPPTLKVVGKSWGVSRERARQIEAAAKKKLRAHLLDNSAALREALPQVMQGA